MPNFTNRPDLVASEPVQTYPVLSRTPGPVQWLSREAFEIRNLVSLSVELVSHGCPRILEEVVLHNIGSVLLA